MATTVHPSVARGAHFAHFSLARLCLAVLALCLTAALPLLGPRIVAAVAASGPTYSVPALDAHLARDPAAWLHRGLRMRAALDSICTVAMSTYPPSCAAMQTTFVDPNPASTAPPLPMVWGKAPGFLAFLRRLPLVGKLVQPPQLLDGSGPAVYQVQLQPGDCVQPSNGPCYEAVLLDTPSPDEAAG
ncbi:MAG TPA: hypothetical protein VHB98_00230 [Chloroflexota bacterium]|nr:hypothetical protein [Chloroflexota bacterium]